ncbi:MAG: molybdopterin molybdotransferase MoeA [Bacteroidia bacterium]|nr:molybdopterin molybdotransferase MoeA [Bacteroidia bacterium]MCF8447110.1 molybdopterin molybdotransferase MoeA [Bacteroidia bacterium]
MISVDEALKTIENHSKRLAPLLLNLQDAMGLVLAKDLISPSFSPPFHQSAMDGYVIHYSSTNLSEPIFVSGTCVTGETEIKSLKAGTAMRIFTGAAIPNGADTILIQEHVLVQTETILLQNQSVVEGQNIRLKGSQIAKGDLAVKAGTKLTAGVIGYLAGLGIYEVEVFPQPKIGILVTGNELVKTGEDLLHGQVFESNSIMLKAALRDGNIAPISVDLALDTEQEITKAIEKALSKCDLVLVTGGISVGDYDFVKQGFLNNGVKELFHKVKQKPGKPLFYGKLEDKLVFGLPGNPSSVLSCYYEYVVPCIRLMMGMEMNPYGENYLPLGHDTFKKGTLTNFLKGKISNGKVYLSGAQESYKLNAYTDSDCLVRIEAEQEILKENDLVRIHAFKDCWH